MRAQNLNQLKKKSHTTTGKLGRNVRNDYSPRAKKVNLEHPDLTAGNDCP